VEDISISFAIFQLMEISTKDHLKKRGRRPLGLEHLLTEEPYSSVLRKMRSAGEWVTLDWVKRQGIRSTRDQAAMLTKPSVSKIMKRLIDAGLVEKDKHKFRLTMKLTQLKARLELQDRLKGTDIAVASPNIVMWGRLVGDPQFGKDLLPRLESVSRALGEKTCTMALSLLEQHVKSIMKDEKISITRKACALIAVREELTTEVEALGWDKSALKKLGIAGIVTEIVEKHGLGLIESKSLQRQIRARIKKFDKGRGRGYVARIKESMYRKEFDDIFKILSPAEAPLVAIYGRTPCGPPTGRSRKKQT